MFIPHYVEAALKELSREISEITHMTLEVLDCPFLESKLEPEVRKLLWKRLVILLKSDFEKEFHREYQGLVEEAMDAVVSPSQNKQ